MTNTTHKSFNSSLFSALVTINNDRDYFSSKESGLERVLQVLHQASDTSREARLNHNCRISGLPFCWSYWRGYGDDAVETKVLSFPMTKISTGWNFILDVEENGNLYLSEGKGTARTSLKLSALNAFSPTTREDMFSVIEYLCNSNISDNPSPEELFWLYKQVLTDAGVETVYHVFDDTKEPRLYKAHQIKNVPETRHLLQFSEPFNNPNPYDDVLAEQPKKHIIMVRWEDKHDRWCCDFVFDGEAWGFNCLNDAGTYPVFDGSFKLDDIDEDTGKVDPEWVGSKMSPELRSELENAVKAVASKSGAKSGSWIVASGKDCYRKWSEVPEENRIHIYVAAPTGVAKYYDDVEEMDFSPEDRENPDMARLLKGSCRFKYHHPAEEDEDDED